MPTKELKLDGGLNDLRVYEAEEFLAFVIETRPSFKGAGGTRSIIAMLDDKQQRRLISYLQEHLR